MENKEFFRISNGVVGLLCGMILLAYLGTIYGRQSVQIADNKSEWDKAFGFLQAHPILIVVMAVVFVAALILAFALDKEKKVIVKE